MDIGENRMIMDPHIFICLSQSDSHGEWMSLEGDDAECISDILS